MDTYTMNKIKSLLRVFLGRTVLCAVLTALFVAASAPLFAQRADVRYAGVFYNNGGTTLKTSIAIGAMPLEVVTALRSQKLETPTVVLWMGLHRHQVIWVM